MKVNITQEIIDKYPLRPYSTNSSRRQAERMISKVTHRCVEIYDRGFINFDWWSQRRLPPAAINWIQSPNFPISFTIK